MGNSVHGIPLDELFSEPASLHPAINLKYSKDKSDWIYLSQNN